MKICCLGDSLTEGDYGVYQTIGVANVHKENYPYYLSLLSGAEVVNYGKCGYKASDCLRDCKNGMIHVQGADVILIMLGSNGGLKVTQDTEENQAYYEIVEFCKTNEPNAKLILCTPPYSTSDSNYVHHKVFDMIERARVFVRATAARYELPLIETTNCKELFLGNECIMQPNDGLHLSKEGYFALASFIFEEMKKICPEEFSAYEGDWTIDIVGDSITWGEHHCTPQETYVAQFAKRIAELCPMHQVNRYDGQYEQEDEPISEFVGPIEVQQGSRGRIDIIRNGVSANTVVRAIERISDFTGELANGKKADIIVLMFGINDARKTIPGRYLTTEEFYQLYHRLITSIRKTDPEAKIVLMSPTYSQDNLEEYSKLVERLATEHNLVFVDQYSVWKKHYCDENKNFGQGTWLSDDQNDDCHPTAEGARMIAEVLLAGVLPLICK